jgi:putative selenium metabolism hydrolase
MRQKELVAFLREIVAISSPSGGEEKVVRRVQQEMEAAGFAEVKIDGFGNVLGRVGNGPRVIAFDAHLDTVGVTDANRWSCDPFTGRLHDGKVYGRGSVDQKAGMAAMIHAGRLIQELGLAEGCQVWMVGSVLEEDADGLCWHYILQEKLLRPELVISTEPTALRLNRGQRGRLELRVAVEGRSSHGSMPELGDNAITKLAPAVPALAALNEQLRSDPFLGKGTCTVTWFGSRGPSLCAVPDHAELHIDRRLTAGESAESAVAEVADVLGTACVEGTIRIPRFVQPTWTGLVYPRECYYPTWTIPEDHVALRAGRKAYHGLFGEEPEIARWNFSTNGVTISGLHGVPCLGFGPGREELAHARDEHVPVEDVVKACAFYAAFPAAYLAATAGSGATGPGGSAA